MENKYYTPELHEFHIGFQYEAKSNANYGYLNKHDEPDWKLQKFSGGYFNDEGSEVDAIEKELKNNNIRVKHLDREDIESLGWSFSNVNTPYFSLNGFDLVINNQWLTIYEDKGADEYSFRGTIKNKSELKKIMQMLNIK